MPSNRRKSRRAPGNTPAKISLPAPKIPADLTQTLPAVVEMTGNDGEIDFSSLSFRQQAALPVLACSLSVAQAARDSGISESTLRRWLADPHFSSLLADLRRQSFLVARQQLLALMPLCATVLAQAMQDPDPAIRLRATNYALSFNSRTVELEQIRSDLENLEASLEIKDQVRTK